MIELIFFAAAVTIGVTWAIHRKKHGYSGDQFGPISIIMTWTIVIGVLANGFCLYFIPSAFLEGNVRHVQSHELSSISPLVDAKQPYYLGSNYEQGKRNISYIDNGKNIPVLSNVSDAAQDDYKIFYDNSGQAHVNLVTYTSEYWIVSPFPLIPGSKTPERTFEFHVPSGTVLEDFTIK